MHSQLLSLTLSNCSCYINLFFCPQFTFSITHNFLYYFSLLKFFLSSGFYVLI
nr:MAG TPA: hypothetical protein [Caudoviricetes sp.]